MKWESAALPLQVIPKYYLFTRISEPPVSIFNFSESHYQMDVVEENSAAFIDTK